MNPFFKFLLSRLRPYFEAHQLVRDVLAKSKVYIPCSPAHVRKAWGFTDRGAMAYLKLLGSWKTILSASQVDARVKSPLMRCIAFWSRRKGYRCQRKACPLCQTSRIYDAYVFIAKNHIPISWDFAEAPLEKRLQMKGKYYSIKGFHPSEPSAGDIDVRWGDILQRQAWLFIETERHTVTPLTVDSAYSYNNEIRDIFDLVMPFYPDLFLSLRVNNYMSRTYKKNTFSFGREHRSVKAGVSDPPSS